MAKQAVQHAIAPTTAKLCVLAASVLTLLLTAATTDAQNSSNSANSSNSSNSKNSPRNKDPKPAAGLRLVSFAPSNTELLYSIGAGEKLVGVCSYCDYPEVVKKKTIVGNFIAASLERLATVKPDKVVCVSGQEALAGQLTHNGYKVLLLKNDRLSDIAKNLKDLAALSESTTRGDQAAVKFTTCVSELKELTSKSTSKPAVFYCVWPQPLLTLGKASYLTEVITVCGGESISKNLEAGYPHFSMEKLVLANPDVIVMPFECKDHSFLEKHPWSSLKAVKNKHVYFLPDPPHDGLARPTMRLTNGLYWLSKKIHPELAGQLDSWSARAQSSLAPYMRPENSLEAKPSSGKPTSAEVPADKSKIF